VFVRLLQSSSVDGCVRDSVLVKAGLVVRRMAAAADVSRLCAKKLDSARVAERRGVYLSEKACSATSMNRFGIAACQIYVDLDFVTTVFGSYWRIYLILSNLQRTLHRGCFATSRIRDHLSEYYNTMKLLTLNFLTCARKICKQTNEAFPLHPREAELEQVEYELNVDFIRNILPRLEWPAMRTISQEVMFLDRNLSRKP